MDFKKVIGSVYLDGKVMEQMRSSYSKIGMLRLDGLFNELAYERLSDVLKGTKFVRKKIPNKYSLGNVSRVEIIEKLFLSQDFLDFVNFISRKRYKKCSVWINEFQHKDYTLLEAFAQDREGEEFFFIFSDKWDDEFGGQIVYKTDDDGFIFSIKENNFILVNKKKDMGRFVKYVNHLAGKKKFYVVDGRFE